MLRPLAYLMLAALFIDRFGWEPFAALALTAFALALARWAYIEGGR